MAFTLKNFKQHLTDYDKRNYNFFISYFYSDPEPITKLKQLYQELVDLYPDVTKPLNTQSLYKIYDLVSESSDVSFDIMQLFNEIQRSCFEGSEEVVRHLKRIKLLTVDTLDVYRNNKDKWRNHDIVELVLSIPAYHQITTDLLIEMMLYGKNFLPLKEAMSYVYHYSLWFAVPRLLMVENPIKFILAMRHLKENLKELSKYISLIESHHDPEAMALALRELMPNQDEILGNKHNLKLLQECKEPYQLAKTLVDLNSINAFNPQTYTFLEEELKKNQNYYTYTNGITYALKSTGKFNTNMLQLALSHKKPLDFAISLQFLLDLGENGLGFLYQCQSPVEAGALAVLAKNYHCFEDPIKLRITQCPANKIASASQGAEELSKVIRLTPTLFHYILIAENPFEFCYSLIYLHEKRINATAEYQLLSEAEHPEKIAIIIEKMKDEGLYSQPILKDMQGTIHTQCENKHKEEKIDTWMTKMRLFVPADKQESAVIRRHNSVPNFRIC